MNKALQHSAYHRLLRVLAVVFALVLIFDSGLVTDTTKKLSLGAQNYVASAVGVKVGVSPTDVNLLTARITELETELIQNEREIAVSLNTEPATNNTNTSTLILSIILFILLVLIVMNYMLDYLRTTAPRLSQKTSV